VLILIRRRYSEDCKGVFGELFLCGKHICWTLENASKIIPSGFYFVENSKSPKFKRELPLLYNKKVPASRGIRIHVGNNAVKDSQGCVLVGMMCNDNELQESKSAETMVTMLCRSIEKLAIVDAVVN